MRIYTLVPAVAFCLAALSSMAAGADSAGCKDSKLLSRLPGCEIAYCSKSDFDAEELTISLTAEARTKHLEGKIEKIRYTCDNKSALQVSRNAEQALRSVGYTIDFTGYDVPNHYVTAHKGPQWVAVEAGEMTGSCAYNLTTVLTGEMTQEMTSDADAWAAEINKSGHVAVYGVEFDTGKATLKPASEKVLSQVLALLQKQPKWNMKIVGHTDSTGTKAGNGPLSEKRAASVVAWLVKHGIAPARLTAAGLGDTQPIADNKTEEGRAHNRRVELVKK